MVPGRSQLFHRKTFGPGTTIAKVVKASSPASWLGVPPGDGPDTGGGTPPKPAGEEAHATPCDWLCQTGSSTCGEQNSCLRIILHRGTYPIWI